jgi:NAD(P)-dependent dehydrogenase (short-subunit alcohol dehydrogenase family)
MQRMSLSGRIALITGGGRGIGAACARRLAGAGARVIVCGRDEAKLVEVAAETGGHAIRVDLSDRTAVDGVMREIGRVDVLVNNAGIAESRKLADADDEHWDRIMEINATAAFRLCRALVPAMVQAKWGRVVNVASNAGLTGYAYTSAYCASKHAMIGFTRALAVDVAAHGVTVNAVCPGWVDTEMADRAVANIAAKTGRGEDTARGALEQMSPQRRMITADEVAHVVAMLCDDGGRGIHGQAIVIDGGALKR